MGDERSQCLRATYNRPMHLYVNGEPFELPGETTVFRLLEHLDMAGVKVAVEVNRHIVPRHAHRQFALHEYDKIEIIQAIGGG